ncbi:MAG: DNA translocase FtsK, partial [Sphingomonadaceae bacterium]|nr:DNA translocase FtsK [Sphingomonadaceae bacterium]
MATNGLAAQMPAWREAMRRAATRSSALVGSLAMMIGVVLVVLALVSYRPSDPAFNTSAAGPAQNWLGALGAYVSETLLILLGPLVALMVPLVIVLALRLWRDAPLGSWIRSALIICGAILLLGSAITLLAGPAIRGLPLGWGGAIGYAGGSALGGAIGLIGNPELARYTGWFLALAAAIGGFWLWWRGLGLDETERAFIFRREAGLTPVKVVAPESAANPKPRKKVAPPPEDKRAPVIGDRKSKQAKAKPKQRTLNLDYELPALELLNAPEEDSGGAIDKAALERNARLLESVLDDFKVKGSIVEVRPGPVVTMYEL